GGVLTDTAAGLLARLMGQEVASYHSFNFAFLFPPAFITGHLGQLSLFDPYQLFAALVEIGPAVLTLPLFVWWGFKVLRARRYYEALLFITAMLGLPFIFMQFNGEAGPTALIRIQVLPFSYALLLVLPLLWLWAARFLEQIKVLLASLLAPALVGGLVLLAVQMVSMVMPVNSFYLDDLDAGASRDFWNKLPADALILDPTPSRSPILFGRFTDAGIDYFTAKPEWEELVAKPDPYVWRARGFTYAYLDQKYMNELSPEWRDKLKQASCMQLVKAYTRAAPEDFRRLYDLNRCR
ncbi:MAG: hypothetical protein LWX83_06765, partial [Anaerolineae bacterium]|nr:hypothetical protein [Anaerolineae bacterium]